jgi:hypothetical protein
VAIIPSVGWVDGGNPASHWLENMTNYRRSRN